YDYLRLLYARIGITYCYNCGAEIQADSPASILATLEKTLPADEVIRIGFPVTGGLQHRTLLDLKRRGFYRVVSGDEILDIDDFYKQKAIEESPPEFYILIDRIRLKGNKQRIADALESAFREGESNAIVEAKGKKFYYSDKFQCHNCRILYSRPDPRAFSFNSPHGACPKCQGFGNIMDLDEAKIIPDPALSLEEFPIAPWNSNEYGWMYDLAKNAPGLPQHIPMAEMKPDQKKLLWEGKGRYPGIRGFFDQLQNKRYKVSVRIFLARYRGYYPCNECNGERLRREGRIVKIGALNISQFCLLDVRSGLDFLEKLQLTPREAKITEKILPELKK